MERSIDIIGADRFGGDWLETDSEFESITIHPSSESIQQLTKTKAVFATVTASLVNKFNSTEVIQTQAFNFSVIFVVPLGAEPDQTDSEPDLEDDIEEKQTNEDDEKEIAAEES